MRHGQRTKGESEVVLDANILVRLVTPGEYEEQAEALWNDLITGTGVCAVPVFCPTEVLSSLRQMGRGGILTPETEGQAVDRFFARIYPALVTIDSLVLSRAAWQLACDLGERHTYDSVYLTDARAFRLEFWTADRQLLRRVGDRFPEAHFLGDYPLPPAA
jgi:predicted nucleic acid-binding protein